MDYLNRSAAPFAARVWDEIDDAAIGAARERLTARRVLDVEGPYGPGLTSIEVGNDAYCRQPDSGEAGAVVSRAIALPMLRKRFLLSLRRVAAYLENGLPLDMAPAEDAAEAVSAREDELIFQGQAEFGLSGLLTAPGRARQAAGNWSDVDRALDDVLSAVTKLDDAGFRGPYAMILEPALYNGLFRRYPGTDLMQLEHLRRLCTDGIHKAPITGGAVIDPRAGVLIIGQDLMAGYVGQDGIHYEFYLSESIALRLDDPEAVCSLDFNSA
ncbi:MAG: bacteriocin family protein [Rhodospirillales bacterium]|nr:bacteriocin family protein [Rhodospirillales bacterium]